jgi:hypothetical protein
MTMLIVGMPVSMLVVGVPVCWHIDQGDVMAVFVGLGLVVIVASEVLVLMLVLDRSVAVPVSVRERFVHRWNGSGVSDSG